VLALAGLYIARTSIIIHFFQKGLEREFHQRKMSFAFEKLELDGLSSFELKHLTVKDSLGQEFLYLGSIHLDYSIWSLMRSKPFLNEFKLDTLRLNINRYQAKIKQEEESTSEEPGETLIGKVRRLSSFLPKHNAFHQISITYSDSLGRSTLIVHDANGDINQFSSHFRLETDSLAQEVEARATIHDTITVSLKSLDKNEFPILAQRAGLSLYFDSLQFRMRPDQMGLLRSEWMAGIDISQLRIKHPKLSADTIIFESGSLTGNYLLTPQSIALDSGAFNLNGLFGSLQFLIPLPNAKEEYALNLDIPWQDANTFFAALPAGAFDDTRNLQAKGEMKYGLRFYLDGKAPDEVVFESSMDKRNFSIQQYPGKPLDFFNDTFNYKVYADGQVTRTIPIGKHNPNFTALEDVNPQLIHAILCSEDPSFFRHHGFIQEAFRESIAENYREKRFKRGASTISMQLVKNLFLNRNKTIFRKFEEALIVYLIEYQGLSTKERMMEVYLNIIEWGPGINGIGEASAYYFNKKPKDLSLNESIFLANIIPRPSKYYWAFEKDGSMKDYMAKLSQFIARRMVKKEFILPSDTVNFEPKVHLKGNAAKRFFVADTSINISDSTEFEPLSLPFE